VRLVELTPRGRDVIEPAFVRHAADLEELVSVLAPDERAVLVTLLRKLGKAAEANLDEPEEGV
jgi:DNA-binding MarR family transcriptional regulator